MIAPNRGPGKWLSHQILMWKQGRDLAYQDDSGLTDTEKLEQLGVELHPAHDGRRSFGLLSPGLHGATYILLRVDGEGNATITGESITEDGAVRMLNGFLDGSTQRRTEAFLAGLTQAASRRTTSRASFRQHGKARQLVVGIADVEGADRQLTQPQILR